MAAGGGRGLNIAQPNPEENPEHAAEKERRAKEQRIGDYFAGLHGFPEWRKKFDMDAEEAKKPEAEGDDVAEFRLRGQGGGRPLLEPGCVYEQKNAKDDMDILFDKERCAKFGNKYDFKDPTSDLFKARAAKLMRFIAINENTSTVKLVLDNPEYKPKSHNKEILKSLIEVAKNEGLSISLKDESVQKFLATLSKEEADKFDQAVHDLKGNREYTKMMMGVGDTENLQNLGNQLGDAQKLEELLGNEQTHDPEAAIRQRYTEKLYKETQEDGSVRDLTTPAEKLESIGKELDQIEKRLEKAKDFSELLTDGLEAQDKLLADPETMRRAMDPDILKTRTDRMMQSVREKFEGKRAEYNDKQKVVDDVQARTRSSEGARGDALTAAEKEIADLKKRQAILKNELQTNFGDNVLATQDLKDKRGKCLERLDKVDEKIKEEVREENGVSKGALVDARKRHEERSGNNADPYFQEARGRIQQEERIQSQPKR